MKILLVGDKHLKIATLEQGIKLMRWIEEVVETHSPDMLVDLGDTFDSHAVLRAEVLCEFKRHVENMRSLAYIYILGNHDFYKPTSSKYHALQTLDLNHLNVVSETTNFSGMHFIPYIVNNADYPANLPGICFAHQSFLGADFGSFKADIGVDPNAVAASIVISGHVHKKQTLGKIFYPGTPMATSLKDIDQVKGLHLFDTDTYAITFIQSPFPVWKSVEIDMSDLVDSSVHNTILNSTNERDHWVIRLKGPRKEIASYAVSKQFMKLRESRDISIRPEHIDSAKVKTSIQGTSMADVVKQYLQKVYSGTIPVEQIEKLAMEILGGTK